MTNLGVVTGGCYSGAEVIADAGVVAGKSHVPGVGNHVVVFQGASIPDLGISGQALDIIAAGQVVGTWNELVWVSARSCSTAGS